MSKMVDASGPPDGSYASTFNVDPRYIVRLTAVGDGGESLSFESSVDETFSIALHSQWAAPFENVLQDALSKAGGAVGQKNATVGKAMQFAGSVAKAFGMNARPKAMSGQIWQNSDPIAFTIPFTFVAVRDPKKEVRDRVVNLLKLVAPSEIFGGYGLQAPGPVPVDIASALLAGGSPAAGRTISFEFGSFLRLTPCIIEGVDVQFDSVIGHDGIPLRAKVNVAIKSWYNTFTTQEIDKMFK